ncbi:MAG: hypothetical protein ACR2HN_12015 [Tepidiformaceae bacterium]
MTAEPPGDREQWDGWLAPRQWGPLVALLLAALAIAGVLLAVRWDSGDGQASASDACRGREGQPGCELRQPVHWHADFALFVRGQRFDFSGPQFVSTEDRHLSENVHIHEPRYSVVHVHTEQTTWDEFLRSLGFELTDPSFAGTTAASTCLQLPSRERLCGGGPETFKFYANGVRVDGIANVDVSDLDRVLISYGPETPEQVLRDQLPQLSDQACIPSELCLDRLPPGGIEKEPCSKSGTTCN